MFGFQVAANSGNLVFGTVNTALGVAKDAPQMLIAASKTLHVLTQSQDDGEASAPTGQSQTSAAPASNSESPLNPNDMAYQRAADISDLAYALQGILDGDIKDSQQELHELLMRIGSALLDFEKPTSPSSFAARKALRECQRIVKEALSGMKAIDLSSDQTSDPRLEGWKRACQEAFKITNTLEAEAASLPGRALGYVGVADNTFLGQC
jgi:hypothetical protein